MFNPVVRDKQEFRKKQRFFETLNAKSMLHRRELMEELKTLREQEAEYEARILENKAFRQSIEAAAEKNDSEKKKHTKEQEVIDKNSLVFKERYFRHLLRLAKSIDSLIEQKCGDLEKLQDQLQKKISAFKEVKTKNETFTEAKRRLSAFGRSVDENNEQNETEEQQTIRRIFCEV